MQKKTMLLLAILSIYLNGIVSNSIFAQSNSELVNSTKEKTFDPFKVTKPQNRRMLFKQRLQYNEEAGIIVPPRFSENEEIWIEYIRNNFPFNPKYYFIYDSALDPKKQPIVISFLVHKDGTISDPIIVKSPKMKLQRLRYFFKRMPRWPPAVNWAGETIDAYYTMQLDERTFYDFPEQQYIRHGPTR